MFPMIFSSVDWLISFYHGIYFDLWKQKPQVLLMIILIRAVLHYLYQFQGGVVWHHLLIRSDGAVPIVYGINYTEAFPARTTDNVSNIFTFHPVFNPIGLLSLWQLWTPKGRCWEWWCRWGSWSCCWASSTCSSAPSISSAQLSSSLEVNTLTFEASQDRGPWSQHSLKTLLWNKATECHITPSEE